MSFVAFAVVVVFVEKMGWKSTDEQSACHTVGYSMKFKQNEWLSKPVGKK